MAKPNKVLQHLQNSEFRDPVPSYFAPDGEQRMTVAGYEVAGGWDQIARIVKEMGTAERPPALLPDANVAILDESEPFWAAAPPLPDAAPDEVIRFRGGAEFSHD